MPSPRILAVLSGLIAAIILTRPGLAGAAGTNRNTLVPPPRRNVPGMHAPLPPGVLYAPDFFQMPKDGLLDVVFFFHGAAWCSEQGFYDARKNAVLVSVSHSNYTALFADARVFRGIVEATLETMKPQGAKSIHRICLSSFSGGYAAIREILKQPEFADRISDVVLADSLYAPRVPGHANELDPVAMKPFLDYAEGAAEERGHFYFSQLYPPEEKYRDNTTTLAAMYLIKGLGAEQRPAAGTNSAGAQLLYRADKGNFHVLGYAGMTTQDHFNHFYGISDLWRETSLENAAREEVGQP